MSQEIIFVNDAEFDKIDELYDECINYLQVAKKNHEDESKLIDNSENKETDKESKDFEDPEYETLELVNEDEITEATNETFEELLNINFKVENELKSNESINTACSEVRSERLRKLSMQLPKIIITQSNTSLNVIDNSHKISKFDVKPNIERNKPVKNKFRNPPALRNRAAYGYTYPRRIVSKGGTENIALISNVPFGKIRLLNDTFHTLINLRWRWIIMATGVIHFTMWLVFAGLWYVTALAHYDFEPVPPKRTCITGGKDFVTIFLASVEAQTTIGFGDRAIDEECPESIFLFVVQLILGTGLTGVLTCVVYAKLTRPEKLSRDGVGFSKKAVISMRDGKLCLMFRAWDFNYDHIIGSEFTAHFIYTHKTSEGDILRYYAHELRLQQRQFLLWPVILVHEIDDTSPLYRYTPEHFANNSYEITVSIKGASASLGTFTQSQSSYLPRELLWGHRFLPVVKYNSRKQKYVVDHQKLDATEAVDTPSCSASELSSSAPSSKSEVISPGTPGSFSDQLSAFHLERSSSFRKKDTKNR